MTAGGTAEAIDPVRYIGNRSTGRMGIAIAEAALARGARVTLVAGRLEVPVPPGVSAVTAESTAAMRDAVVEAVFLGRADALVMAAAVADFRPAHAATTKLTRDAGLTIELEPTEDILAEVGAQGRHAGPAPRHRRVRRRDRAASSGRRTSSAARAPTSWSPTTSPRPGSGFGTETNRVSILGADGSRDDLPLLSKREVADRLLDRVARLLDERGTTLDDAEPRWTNGGPRRRLDR